MATPSFTYRYPAMVSSAPSPLITIFTPRLFTLRARINMGVPARMVVMSYVSRW